MTFTPEEKEFFSAMSDEEMYSQAGIPFVTEESINLDIEHAEQISSLWASFPEDFIYCCMFGDGFMNPRGTVTLEQGPRQKAYLYWKWTIVNILNLRSPQARIIEPSRVLRVGQQPNSPVQFSYRFSTASFLNLRNEFYKGKQRVLPKNFKEKFNDALMAIWLMDDGCKENSERGILLDVSRYNSQDRLIIVDTLRENYNLNPGLRGFKENDCKLNLRVQNLEEFVDRIEPFIAPSLYHKIRRNY